MIALGTSAALGGVSTAIAANAAMAIQSTARSKKRFSSGVVVVVSAAAASIVGVISHHEGGGYKEGA